MAWLSLLGGLALFTYGFDLTAKGLRRIAARRLRKVLAPVARSAIWGGIFGFLVTLLTGSSTATTMMMVGLVAAGALGLAQALNVILGAALGTTVVVQIIAFPLVQELAPALVLIGVLWRLFERRRIIRGPGESVLGFGLTLYGLGVIFRSAELLVAEPGFRAGFLALARGNIAVFLVTAVFTALVANSATAIALGFSFARHGLLGPAAEAAVVLGANLGAAGAAFLQSLFQSMVARRTALGYLLMKTAAVLLLLPFLDGLGHGLPLLSREPARAMADFHSLFNLGLLLLFLPLTGRIGTALRRLWPSHEAAEKVAPALWEERPADPDLALAAAGRALAVMAERLGTEMLSVLPRLFRGPTEAELQSLRRAERETDQVFGRLQRYLQGLEGLGTEGRFEKTRLLYQAGELEHLGDTAVRLSGLALKLYNLEFSPSELPEGLDRLFDEVGRLYRRTVEGLRDKTAAREVLAAWPELARREEEVRYELLGAERAAAVTAVLLEVADGLLEIGRRAVGMSRMSLGVF